jgi:hypothetical protein
MSRLGLNAALRRDCRAKQGETGLNPLLFTVLTLTAFSAPGIFVRTRYLPPGYLPRGYDTVPVSSGFPDHQHRAWRMASHIADRRAQQEALQGALALAAKYNEVASCRFGCRDDFM